MLKIIKKKDGCFKLFKIRPLTQIGG